MLEGATVRVPEHIRPVDTPATPGESGSAEKSFCPACGSLLTSISPCSRCARSAETLATLQIEDAREGRPVRSAVVLYSLLLAVSILAIAIGNLGDFGPAGQLTLEWIAQGVHMAIVLMCAAVLWPTIRPAVCRTVAWYWLALGPMLGVMTFASVSLLMKGVSLLTGVPTVQYSPEYFDAGFGWTAIVVSIAVQPAMIEELAFRGMILPRLSAAMPVGAALTMSSFMFMALHLSPISFPHLLCMGVVLGCLRVWSGSLYPPMLMHFTHNLLVVIHEQHPILPFP